jgi:putative inorganic carbon (HCO3(-)) transporter
MHSQRKIESVFLWGAKLPLFLLPFIPLVVTPDLIFPYISGKNFVFRILVEFSLAMYVPLVIGVRRHHPATTPILLSILFFTLIVGIANLQGVNPYKSFWSNYERMEGYITILHLTVLFILLQSLFKTKRDWMILLNLFVLCGVLVCIYAIINPIPMKISGFTEPYKGRLYGSLGNPPFLASYLILIVFLVFIIICNIKKPLLKPIYILIIVLNLIVIYLTVSRGVSVAIFGGIIFFLIAWSYLSKGDLKKKIAIIFLFVVIFSVLLTFILGDIGFISNSKIYQRFASIPSDPSVKSRLETWKIAWNGFKKRPILGWGQENFIGVYIVNKLPLTSKAYMFTDRAHNIIIDWIISTGVLGLFSLFILFFISISTLKRKFRVGKFKKSEYLTILIAFIVYLIQDLFTFDTISTYLIIFTLFAYIDTIDNNAETQVITEDKRKIGCLLFISIVSLCSFLLLFYILNLKPIKQGLLYRHIMRSYPERYQNYSQLLHDFNMALLYKSLADSDIRRQMIYVSTYILKKRLFDIEGAKDFINKTVKEAEKEIMLDAKNLKKARLIIKFYYDIAKIFPSFIPRFEALLKEYIRISPEYEWLYYELADAYSLGGDYNTAFDIIKDMATREPFSDIKQFKLILAAILASRGNMVKNSLDTIREIRRLKNENGVLDKETLLTEAEIYLIAQTYIKKGEFLKALQYYKKLVDISPEDASYHFDMAMVYLALGDKEKAIREAKKASELDPVNYMDKAKRLINLTKNKP